MLEGLMLYDELDWEVPVKEWTHRWTVPTSYLTDYMEQSHSWEANTHPSLPLNKFPALFRYKFHDCSQHPSTGACPKADNLIQYTSCSSYVRSNIIVHLRAFLPNGLFSSVFPPQGCAR